MTAVDSEDGKTRKSSGNSGAKNGENIRNRILKKIADAESDWTPALLVQTVSRETGKTGREIRGYIQELVGAGHLAYLVNHGRTCIRKAWQRPFFVGEKTQLLPPGVSPVPGERIALVLRQGASFGGGDHATTRLCISAIERFAPKNGSMLDVGTGSGILAIAAVRHGMDSALGVDTDPLSLYEAQENVFLNGLASKIEIRETWEASPQWNLVAANLRPPTLLELSGAFVSCLMEQGVLVLSGMRHDEMAFLAPVYAGQLEELERKTEKGWGCLVFRKAASPGGPGPFCKDFF